MEKNNKRASKGNGRYRFNYMEHEKRFIKIIRSKTMIKIIGIILFSGIFIAKVCHECYLYGFRIAKDIYDNQEEINTMCDELYEEEKELFKEYFL